VQIETGHVVLRPSGVRVLALVTWVMVLVYLALTITSGLQQLLLFSPTAALVCFLVYILFWRPRLVVDGQGVTLVNVLRDVRIPFSRIRSVQTRYTMTVETEEGDFSSWAAPAPGRTSAMSLSRREASGANLMGADLSQGIGASTAPNTDSGAAALLVRHRWQVWEEKARKGAPDERVNLTWNWLVLLTLAVLTIATVLTIVL